jgi:hypothetical protein
VHVLEVSCIEDCNLSANFGMPVSPSITEFKKLCFREVLPRGACVQLFGVVLIPYGTESMSTAGEDLS